MEPGRTWIGATDEKNEGQWTDTHGKALEFFKWASSEPNEQGGEDCVHNNHEETRWNDIDCWYEEVKNYACQYGK